MTKRKHTERIVEGEFLAEVDVELLNDELPDVGWGPYYSVADVRKLEAVRKAMQSHNLIEAGRFARVFRLTPVSAA